MKVVLDRIIFKAYFLITFSPYTNTPKILQKKLIPIVQGFIRFITIQKHLNNREKEN